MFKQIFNKADGKPKLVQAVIDEETGKEYFDYNESEYTEEMPPFNLYEPIYFENDAWKGATKEEWEYERGGNNTDPHIPNTNEIMLAQAQMQITKTANQLVKSQKEQAETLKELAAKELRLKELEALQAQTMLEIVKLKGE